VVNHIVHLVRYGEDVLEVLAAELLDREDVLAIPRGEFVVAEGQVGLIGFGGHVESFFGYSLTFLP